KIHPHHCGVGAGELVVVLAHADAVETVPVVQPLGRFVVYRDLQEHRFRAGRAGAGDDVVHEHRGDAAAALRRVDGDIVDPRFGAGQGDPGVSHHAVGVEHRPVVVPGGQLGPQQTFAPRL